MADSEHPGEALALNVDDLPQLIDRAEREGWRSLALIPKDIYEQISPANKPEADHLYFLDRSLRPEDAVQFSRLTGLTTLDVSWNEIGDDGARALSGLINLTSLYVSSNEIGDDGARALSGLVNLTSLDIWGNEIGADGARALSGLVNLTSLDIWGNQIGADGARALSGLVNFTSLDVSYNKIGDDGARALSGLVNLTSLDVSENQIGDDGARALSGLFNLTSLNVSGNQIGAEGARALLDACVDSWTPNALRRLSIYGNEGFGEVLPDDVLGTSDAQAILAAYRRFREAGRREALRPLNEAKLIVVGDEAVGKTSLIRYLVEGLPRDPDEGATTGIETHEQIETRDWTPEGSDIRINIWDFAGQVMRQGTHRYFLSQRCLYLLVLEDRREDDRSVYDWLKTIRSRGGDSPVLVLINKSDRPGQEQLRLNETALFKDHESIVGFMRVSVPLKNGEADWQRRAVADLRKKIMQTMKDDPRLEEIRRPVPQSWLEVRRSIGELARERRVLPTDEFKTLCEKPQGGGESPITDDNEKRALLRMLHDLGVVVAYGLKRDAPVSLRDVTLLDPNWLTGAFYTLLTSRQVADQKGEFDREQLDDLLNRREYPQKHDEFILQMMQDEEVGLAFALQDVRQARYLIPEALPVNEPEYGMSFKEALRFRIKYETLPRGLIPRFIVETHQNMSEKPTPWSTGIVLEVGGCYVLVRGDLDRQRIDISVEGSTAGQKRSALSVVLNDLKMVHRRDYPEVGPKLVVPLPDQPEKDVSYEHLLKLEDMYGREYAFLPEDADREYKVCELLEGVRIEAVQKGRVDEFGGAKYGIGHAENLTIVDGNVSHRGQGPIGIGETGRSEYIAQDHAVSKPGDQPFRDWFKFSFGCGLAAMVLAAAIWFIPDDQWRFNIAVLLGIGISVFLFVMAKNPEWYFRRILSYVIPAGFFINALGFKFGAGHESEEAKSWFLWDGTAGWVFTIAWVVIVVALIVAELVRIKAKANEQR